MVSKRLSNFTGTKYSIPITEYQIFSTYHASGAHTTFTSKLKIKIRNSKSKSEIQNLHALTNFEL